MLTETCDCQEEEHAEDEGATFDFAVLKSGHTLWVMPDTVCWAGGHPQGRCVGFKSKRDLGGELSHHNEQVEMIWASDFDTSCTPPCGVTRITAKWQ